MIISILLRLALIYFIWTLARRLWASYQNAQRIARANANRTQHTQRPSKPKFDSGAKAFEAEFRVLDERD